MQRSQAQTETRIIKKRPQYVQGVVRNTFLTLEQIVNAERDKYMPRILGVDIPKEKRIEIALTYLYGIGRTLSNRVLSATGIDPNKRAKDLTDEETAKLASYIQKEYKVEGDLRREVSSNIKRFIDIGSYRGLRHKRGLPVRGQRTRTNARTRKGPRKTVGVTRKKEVGGGAAKAAAAAAAESKG